MGFGVQSCLWLRVVRVGERQAPRVWGVWAQVPHVPPGGHAERAPSSSTCSALRLPWEARDIPGAQGLYWGQVTEAPLPTKFQVPEGKPVVPRIPLLVRAVWAGWRGVQLHHLGTIPRAKFQVPGKGQPCSQDPENRLRW